MGLTVDGLKPDELSFKIGSQSVHVTQSKETKYRLTSADTNPPTANGGLGSAPDQKGAIGVTIDSVQGCDILVPKFEFTLSRQRLYVDFPYIRTLRNMVGKTNNASFYGFPANTLIYLGCEPTSSISTLDTGDKFVFWNLAHSFGYEETRLAQIVGGVTIPTKRGWEYVWALYKPIIDSAAVGGAQLTQNPTGIYVERMYDEANYELIEIGS